MTWNWRAIGAELAQLLAAKGRVAPIGGLKAPLKLAQPTQPVAELARGIGANWRNRIGAAQ
jgi:hypothetical protein